METATYWTALTLICAAEVLAVIGIIILIPKRYEEVALHASLAAVIAALGCISAAVYIAP